jgi:hypothetical protein
MSPFTSGSGGGGAKKGNVDQAHFLKNAPLFGSGLSAECANFPFFAHFGGPAPYFALVFPYPGNPEMCKFAHFFDRKGRFSPAKKGRIVLTAQNRPPQNHTFPGPKSPKIDQKCQI